MVMRSKVCRECGQPFQAKSMNAGFCATACRASFNRRRRDRGAELYDFVMAAAPAAHPMVKTLVQVYRDADVALRAGRPSYQREVDARAALPVVFGEKGDGR
jgi:hypothetical protein